MYNEAKGVPVRETEVGRVMSNLSESLERLTQTIDATEARLEGVVRNTPSESCDKTAEAEYNTKFAQDVNNINRKVVLKTFLGLFLGVSLVVGILALAVWGSSLFATWATGHHLAGLGIIILAISLFGTVVVYPYWIAH